MKRDKLDSKERARRFHDLPVDEQVRQLYRQGVPTRMYDPLNHKWITPIRDTVRTQSGNKLTQQQITAIVRSLPSIDHEAAREARQYNLKRARQITHDLSKLNFGFSYHYRAVVLGHVDQVNSELKYDNYYTNVTPPVRERHRSSTAQRIRQMIYV